MRLFRAALAVAERGRCSGAAVLCALALAGASVMATSASASTEECLASSAYKNCGSGWELSARNYPTNLAPGHKGAIEIEVFNVGAGSSKGVVTVTDTLPPGVKATEAGDLSEGIYTEPENITIGHIRWDCTGNGEGEAPKVDGATVVTCANDPERMPTILGGAGGTSNGGKGNARIGIAVRVEPGAADKPEAPQANRVTVAGGGAPSPASTTDPITISATPSNFRFADFDAWLSNPDGTLDTQAGSHPYAAVFSFGITNVIEEHGGLVSNGNEPRNVVVGLPPGFIGDPTAVPQCTLPALAAHACPVSSEIGNAEVATFLGASVKLPIYNMVPRPGLPAEFGFKYEKTLLFLDAGVRTGSDNGINASVNNIPEEAVSHVVTTIWGVPGDPSHNRWRGKDEKACTEEEMLEAGKACSAIGTPDEKPLLTLPTACGAPPKFTFPKFTIRMSTWEHPEAAPIEDSVELHDSNGGPAGLTGCEDLGFGPNITTAPDTARADAPAGFTLELQPPLGGLEDVNGLSTSEIRGASVTLPEGLVINPGQAAGLQACQPSQDALTTEVEKAEGRENDGPASCPPASKVGTVSIKSPLLEGAAEKQLEGNIYVMQSNPPDIKLLIAGSADGVNVKEVVDAHLNEATGQLEGTASGIAQLPFSDFKLTFEGGAKAALVTPSQCGTYETNADLTPWSSPFLSDFNTNASFSVTAGPGGGPCPSGSLPFAPSLAAGSTNTEAGAFTGFTQLLSRGDGQQRIEKFQFKEPAGMAGMLSQVPLCPEPQASQGACDEASKIGHAIVQSGPGNNPLTLPQPGGPEIPIYLTGPYHGAPFGLSIKTPVVAGPFNLGTIVTRAKIEVDPNTAQITIATDALPQILDGVPTDLRSIDAVIDRQGFLFNPTNCTPQEFVGTATSAGGAAVAPISSHFGIGACKALKFAPKFSASTSAKTSKANGASLHVKIAYPNEPQGSEADIAKVNLTIPAILPTRLTTIQKACTEAQFNANPAGCPAASVIATAIVHTPVLKSPLTGPAYFVSHGGAAFPDVEMILQGEGVTLIVDGKTQIKKGVTFSHFETVPDAPFTSFEFIAPQGPFSIFTANGNLCATEVKMPTTLTAQNGAVLTQSTPVEVQGCPNGLRILSHSIRNRTLTIKVIVPGAGKLTASGKGLSTSSKSSKGRSTLTLTIKAKKGGRLRTKVKLSFAPTKGKRLAAAVAARFKG
jgi:hypothetical protein